MNYISHKMRKILVSIVVCGYNREDFIQYALNSILKQTFDKRYLEIVIVTNYEMQESTKLMMGAQCDFTILQGSDEPLGSYYSKAINVARGEIISFLDDDDEFAPEKLDYIMDKFNKDPELVFINNDVVVIDSYGNQLTNMENDFRFKSGRTHEIILDAENPDLCYEAIRRHGNFCNSSISVKKSKIKDYGERLKLVAGAEDDFFFFSSLFSGGKLLISERRLTYYRVHSKNKTTYVKINLMEALQRMRIEMPKALHSLESALEVSLIQKAENCYCYIALHTYYEILEMFSSTNFERARMPHLIIKYIKAKPWKLASSHRKVLLISALSLISVSIARNFYRVFGLGK